VGTQLEASGFRQSHVMAANEENARSWNLGPHQDAPEFLQGGRRPLSEEIGGQNNETNGARRTWLVG
jgi:hypothetical protein